MNREERVIPGYKGYSVTKDGVIRSIERDLILRQYLLDGYFIVDAFRGSLTETLPVHRAVALAWVENKNPQEFYLVNHCDGIKTNNFWTNLEWTNHSGNNYHAVNTGLRSDNIPCKIRDFFTKEVFTFPSMKQAAEFVGVSPTKGLSALQPKMFGKLVSGRYEVKQLNDPSPWFYESRDKLVPPSRFMVEVKDSDGTTREIYSNKDLLQEYQLYGAPGKSIPVMAEFASTLHPDKEFTVRDSYTELRYRENRQTRGSEEEPVLAIKDLDEILFDSLTQCAAYFNVDRSSIIARLGNGKTLNGWYFILSLPP